MHAAFLAKKGGGQRHRCLCKWAGGQSWRPGMMEQMADAPRLTLFHPTSKPPHIHHQQPLHDESIWNRDIITSGCQPSHATSSNWEMTKSQSESILGLKTCRRVSNYVPLCRPLSWYNAIRAELNLIHFFCASHKPRGLTTYTRDKMLNPHMSKSAPSKFTVI